MSLSRAVDLARRLIRCRSVTPADGGALPLLAEVLRAAGFQVDLPIFSEPGQPDVLNLYASVGEGPCLAFAGHTDVVPPGDASAWTHDPFAGVIADGRLYGRGACDMKGGIAAFVAAALDHLDRYGTPSHSRIALLITGDEEGPAVNGTVKLLDWAVQRGARFDACVVGEPTNPEALGDMVKIGRRGSLTGTLTVRGRQGHVAYPDRAINPIPPLICLLGAMTGERLDDGNGRFDPSNLEIVSVDTGNPSSNVIPAETRARFNVRFNDRWSSQTLRTELEDRVGSASGGTRYSLVFEPCNAEPFLTEPGAFTTLVADAIEAEVGRRPVLSTSGGTSDARFIAKVCPVVEFGLVGGTMHQTDEHVAVDDIDRLSAVYARIVAAFLANPAQGQRSGAQLQK